MTNFGSGLQKNFSKTLLLAWQRELLDLKLGREVRLRTLPVQIPRDRRMIILKILRNLRRDLRAGGVRRERTMKAGNRYLCPSKAFFRYRKSPKKTAVKASLKGEAGTHYKVD